MDELITFVRQGLERTKGRWPEVAERSGVSYSWISKYGAGTYNETNVGYFTLKRVADALRDLQ